MSNHYSGINVMPHVCQLYLNFFKKGIPLTNSSGEGPGASVPWDGVDTDDERFGYRQG